jgi:D-alanyl-D-alanine endopeptidase (penicillin-binding protein 7)
MTAVAFLEHEFDLGREVTVDRVDMRGASTTYLRGGERIAVDDLLHLLLIASDNVAARTLARVSLVGYDGFIERMNTKAQELGLTTTHYADPSGLDARNVSSAFDMARLIAFAASDERIAPIMRKSEHTLTTSRRTITVHNTNRLVGSEVDVRGGKTGFIRKSGYCLATLLKLPQSGDQVAVVVLGARSSAARFWETRHIFNWLSAKTSQVVQNPE